MSDGYGNSRVVHVKADGSFVRIIGGRKGSAPGELQVPHGVAIAAQARTLREGLDSNREIGKAVGLMMAFHKVGDDDAFDILRKASQDMNLKISEIAGQIVHHHNQRPTT